MLEHFLESFFVFIKDKKMSVVSVFLNLLVLLIHAYDNIQKTWPPRGRE